MHYLRNRLPVLCLRPEAVPAEIRRHDRTAASRPRCQSKQSPISSRLWRPHHTIEPPHPTPSPGDCKYRPDSEFTLTGNESHWHGKVPDSLLPEYHRQHANRDNIRALRISHHKVARSCPRNYGKNEIVTAKYTGRT